MQPLRTFRSEADLEAVAPVFLVCTPIAAETIFEQQQDRRMVELYARRLVDRRVWEHMTGADEMIILDEDRDSGSIDGSRTAAGQAAARRKTPPTTYPRLARRP